METKNIIDDNARLQQENWEFKKAGCSNKDHISLILQIEKKDKKLEKCARIIIENKQERDQFIKEMVLLEKKEAQIRSNHDEKDKEIQVLKEKLIASEKSLAEHKVSLKYFALESKLIDYIAFNTIKNWIDKSPKNYSFKIIYRASDHGFSALSFHSACDGEGPTVTVIKTTDGCVFGGYNSQSWISAKKFNGFDENCFIFTLVNKHGIPPTKYIPASTKSNYSYCSSAVGPCFGFGDIQTEGQKGTQSFPDTYLDTTGKGESTLTPSYEFIIQDYEVYQCFVD
ncbi:hypothetical protein CYY_007588 [Polysphondylium violaceum]|uniref:TLDc domain-containing protein n=1 Tax=Polysphondylium violaceum TaxID=133409 RepID=A0A8J4V239_9MYCE|nr:hypothetical protein CYY_007588 [Polysphondylium violaceum]